MPPPEPEPAESEDDDDDDEDVDDEALPIGRLSIGGASGKNDFGEAIVTAVINKRAGGTGLISGRKAFQRPMNEGIELLNAIQDVYLSPEITVA